MEDPIEMRLADSNRSKRDSSLADRNAAEIDAGTQNHNAVSKSNSVSDNAPKGVRFAVLFACIVMGSFFTGYDTSCVTTLTSVISDEFHSLDSVGWYGIAYVLAVTTTLLTFGQLYTLFQPRHVFIASNFIFAVGSVICAAAPTNVAFIIGRAITGLGSSGVFAGGNIIVARTTSLRHRPVYQGFSGGIECVGLAFGPLIAGAIANGSSWRTAFWITVPTAGLSAIGLLVFVPNIPPVDNGTTSHSPPSKIGERLQQLDWPGMLCFVPTCVCLTLSLSWGGIAYPWSDSRVVALLALTVVMTLAFGIIESRQGDKAMFPVAFLRQRSVILGAISQLGISGSLFVFGFYLPIYFQAIRDSSPQGSALMYLPTALSFAIAIFSAGNITSFLGYYTPMMVLGTVFLSVGAGLMTTFEVDTPAIEWIWYQIMYGIGAGLAFQQTYTAVQTVLPEKSVATALVCLSFAQELGGIISLAVAQNVFLNLTVSRLTEIVPGLSSTSIKNQGTVSLPKSVPAEYRDAVFVAYNKSIADVFYLGLVFSCITICSIGIEWRSVKKPKLEGKER